CTSGYYYSLDVW
nr:immunoglobulin heavy chain junction region [Macaca mulatta]MPN69700.1 immunoglobulin heavy chain junction region [Macaca mulatta]MPN69797.1 immunoglobulin heavy chain junction region [Macaca mulatta]MPN70366.1 immunoglobulin heavy chain junction region [Macaca mulatta]MPN71309.1 immunoglobulin heavy chain junction region [Macaca mulatta]